MNKQILTSIKIKSKHYERYSPYILKYPSYRTLNVETRKNKVSFIDGSFSRFIKQFELLQTENLLGYSSNKPARQNKNTNANKTINMENACNIE